MKKLFLSSAALTVFAISILLFQFSCREDVIAQTPSVSNIIIYSKANSLGEDEIWKANIDGTNQQRVNIALPSGYSLNVNNDGGQIRITSDGQKIIFKGENSSTVSLFSCALDGSNVVKLIDGVGTSFDVN